MKTATNPETGERVYQTASGQWEPLQTATNPQTGEQVALGPDGWEPMGAPEEASVDSSRNRARAVLQGATLSFGDEIAAAIAAPFAALATGNPIGEVYRDIVDAERQEYGEFKEQNPWTAGGLELAGGLATGGAAGARFAGSKAGQALAGAPLRTRAAGAAGIGSGVGAVTGAGEAENMGDIPGRAAQGAVIGAALGPAAELGATAGGRLMHALGPERAAERAVGRGIARSGLTPEQAAQRVQAMGPGATIADVGEASAATLETVANQPGATRGAAQRQLAARSRQQAQEVTEPFGPGRVIEMGEALAQQRKAQAGPLYDRAFERGVRQSDELDEILNESDVVQKAWKRARNTGRDEAVARGEVLDPAMLGSDAAPSLQGWQEITKHLNDMIASAQRGAKPKPSQVARLTAIKNRINAELDQQSPDYAQARKIWAGSKAFEDAMEQGRRFLRDSSSVTAKALKDMSPPDRDAYRVGVAQALQDRIEDAGDLHDVSRFFRTAGMRAKLKVLFPDSKHRA